MKMTQIEQWIREEGIKEGEMKKALDTARATLKKELPEDVVAEITGLNLDAVRKLKADLYNNISSP